jgi:hypothetical protein
MKLIFAGSSGMNNADDPVRIRFDAETGVSDLQYAVDVQVERNGRVSRRKTGYELTQEGAYHSLFCNGGDCFVGKGGLLYQVLEDETLRGVRSGLSGEWIAYAQRGEETYYSNGMQKGVIISGVSAPWNIQQYLGPETTEQFSGPPTPKHMAVHKGRMYLNDAAERNVLYRSEFGQMGLYSKAINHWKFASALLMILSVDSGLFISDEKSIYFLRTTGERPTLEKKADYPAVEWSESTEMVEGAKIGANPGLCGLWRGQKGACLGTPDGQLINMTESKVVLMNTCEGRGASLYMDPYLITTAGA